MSILCKIGIHIESFLSSNIAGGSSCPCGKKSTPLIEWLKNQSTICREVISHEIDEPKLEVQYYKEGFS